MKIFENIDYNNLVTSYNSFVDSRKKHMKMLNELEPLAVFIYKTIWETYGDDYLEHVEDAYMEDLYDNWGDLSIREISDVDNNGLFFYYDFEVSHKYGDSETNSYYLALSKEQFEHYQERFEMSKETNKYNL